VALRQDPAVCEARLSNTFTQPTWTVSATYAANDDLNLYAKASHGFRSGGQNYRGSTVVESFAPFQPETVNEYETGLKSELFDRTVRLNLALFYDKMSNVQRSVIIQVPSTGATATVQTNAARATIYGAEAEGTWRITPQFTLDGGIGWIHPKYDSFHDFTGDRSGEDWPTPKVQYSVDATYTVPLESGDLIGSLTWSGRSSQNLYPASKQKQQVTQEAYGLLAGRLTWAVKSENVELSIFGRNLLDKKYSVGAVGLESIGWNAIIAGEPRTYGVELVKRFGGV
jgi:iron complex outermembrane receptor protein